jgi:hypothetical protein
MLKKPAQWVSDTLRSEPGPPINTAISVTFHHAGSPTIYFGSTGMPFLRAVSLIARSISDFGRRRAAIIHDEISRTPRRALPDLKILQPTVHQFSCRTGIGF